jgi:hypothetical protein
MKEVKWNFPEKSEFPKKTGYFIIILIVDNEVVHKIDFWNGCIFKNYDFYVHAWCELPIFNKQENNS